MQRRLDNNSNSIQKVLDGIRKAADIITATMGGSGKNVLIFENKQFSNGMKELVDRTLTFTKDGVSVAQKIKFKDTEEDAGAQMLITAANKTVTECGDGTTLTSLLTKEFVDYLFTECKTRAINDVLDQWESEINLVIQELNKGSKKIDSNDDIYNIALTSCKSESLARMISTIYKKVGLKANISVQLSTEIPYTYDEIT